MYIYVYLFIFDTVLQQRQVTSAILDFLLETNATHLQ